MGVAAVGPARRRADPPRCGVHLQRTWAAAERRTLSKHAPSPQTTTIVEISDIQPEVELQRRAGPLFEPPHHNLQISHCAEPKKNSTTPRLICMVCATSLRPVLTTRSRI